jgi:hypothetical protein
MTKNSLQDNQQPDQDLNRGLREHEAGDLTIDCDVSHKEDHAELFPAQIARVTSGIFLKSLTSRAVESSGEPLQEFAGANLHCAFINGIKVRFLPVLTSHFVEKLIIQPRIALRVAASPCP